MSTLPITKLEVAQMKHSIQVALSEYTSQLDEDLQKAIDQFCTPENLERIVRDESNKMISQIIQEQVREWFMYGSGKEIIKKAVEKKLQDGTTWTPLDDVK